LQTILIEAAKLAPRDNPQLAAVHDGELKPSQSGDAGGGAQAGGLLKGRGQERETVSGSGMGWGGGEQNEQPVG
jgi:hypothetical protein